MQMAPTTPNSFRMIGTVVHGKQRQVLRFDIPQLDLCLHRCLRCYNAGQAGFQRSVGFDAEGEAQGH
jgi:hypothetical protein